MLRCVKYGLTLKCIVQKCKLEILYFLYFSRYYLIRKSFRIIFTHFYYMCKFSFFFRIRENPRLEHNVRNEERNFGERTDKLKAIESGFGWQVA